MPPRSRRAAPSTRQRVALSSPRSWSWRRIGVPSSPARRRPRRRPRTWSRGSSLPQLADRVSHQHDVAPRVSGGLGLTSARTAARPRVRLSGRGLFLLPAGLYLALLTFYPLFELVRMSVSRVTPEVLYQPWPFVGLEEFQRAISTADFRDALVNTLIYVMVVLLSGLIGGLISGADPVAIDAAGQCGTGGDRVRVGHAAPGERQRVAIPAGS